MKEKKRAKLGVKRSTEQKRSGFMKLQTENTDLPCNPRQIFTILQGHSKRNILINFHDNRTEVVASRVQTRFF